MENIKKKSNVKQIVIGLIALVIVVVAALAIYNVYGPKTTKGAKAITVQVVDNEGATKTYSSNTDAENLRQALAELDDLTIDGEESEYGLMVDTVNGLKAVYVQDNAYWSFYVNDEYCTVGIDTQPVNDGDRFKIEYTTAQ